MRGESLLCFSFWRLECWFGLATGGLFLAKKSTRRASDCTLWIRERKIKTGQAGAELRSCIIGWSKTNKDRDRIQNVQHESELFPTFENGAYEVVSLLLVVLHQLENTSLLLYLIK